MFSMDFLDGPKSEALYDDMVARIKADAAAFETRAADNVAPDRIEDIRKLATRWLQEPGADAALTAWIDDIILSMADHMPGNGPVGHDARHLAKDMAAGLRNWHEIDGDAYDALTVIPSFLHDTGRMVEAAFSGVVSPAKTSPDHPLFSFAIANQFADKDYFKAIPKPLTDHILYAVLLHNNADALRAKRSPDKPVIPMDRAVQTSDREQLIGPEGIARLMAVQSGSFDQPVVIADTSVRNTVPKDWSLPDDDGVYRWDNLSSIEAYLRNLFPACNAAAEAHADKLKIISAAFLIMAAPNNVREQIFAPELARDIGEPIPDGKKIIPEDMWQAAKAEVTGKPYHVDMSDEISLTEAFSPVTAQNFIFGAAGNAAADAERANFAKGFDALPVDQKFRLTKAILFAQSKRPVLDRADCDLLSQPQRYTFVQTAANWALGKLQPA